MENSIINKKHELTQARLDGIVKLYQNIPGVQLQDVLNGISGKNVETGEEFSHSWDYLYKILFNSISDEEVANNL